MVAQSIHDGYNPNAWKKFLGADKYPSVKRSAIVESTPKRTPESFGTPQKIKTTTGKKNTGPYLSIMCCECGIFNPPDRTSCLKCGAKFEVIEIIQGERRGELMALFNVYMVYAEDRDSPIIEEDLVVADSEEQAKTKAAFLPKKGWDLDYFTVFAKPICEVVVKERPTEILQVTKKKGK